MFHEPFWILEAACPALENTILTNLSGDQKGFHFQVGSGTQKQFSNKSGLWGKLPCCLGHMTSRLNCAREIPGG